MREVSSSKKGTAWETMKAMRMTEVVIPNHSAERGERVDVSETQCEKAMRRSKLACGAPDRPLVHVVGAARKKKKQRRSDKKKKRDEKQERVT